MISDQPSRRTLWIVLAAVLLACLALPFVQRADAQDDAPVISQIAIEPDSANAPKLSSEAISATSENAEGDSKLGRLWGSTGIHGFLGRGPDKVTESGETKPGQPGILKFAMIAVGLLLIYLGIAKGFEPLLLIPIGFGGILANIPYAGVAEPGGFLYLVYEMGIETTLFPLLIFLGVGAMTDFGPLIANPKTALLGAAAQIGIFVTLIGALFLTKFVPGMDFSIQDASAIGIIGGADGPTAIFLASQLAPELLGAIAVAAYSYMALVPIIQPPIMKALTTQKEREIVMTQLRPVTKAERICFPLIVLVLCILLLPSATPLVGMLMLGNLFKECGVVERLSRTASNELINIVTILLGLAVGSKLAADKFLSTETLGIIALGLVAFGIGTACGVLLARVMNKFARTEEGKINPLIGSAGVSAVPMAARVSNRVGMEANPSNYLLMHAMGPNVAGVIGSAVAAGVLLALVG